MIEKVRNNIGWNILYNIVNIINGLLSTMVVSRYLGANQYGEYGYIISYCVVFSSIAFFGMENVLISEFRFDGKIGKVFNSSVWFLKWGTCFVFLFAILIGMIISKENERVYIIIMSIPILFESFEPYIYIQRSKLQSRKFVLIQIVNSVITLLMRICGVMLSLSLAFFFIVTALHETIIHLSGWISEREFRWAKTKYDYETLVSILAKSFPLIISSVAITIYSKVDQLMVRKMCGLHESGIYYAAVSIAEFWYFIPQVIASSFLPQLTDSATKSKVEYSKNMQICLDILTSVSYIAILCFWVFGVFGIQILYGTDYLEALPILNLYILSSLFKQMGYARGLTCVVYDKTRLTMKCTILGAIINVILNYYLIRIMGLKGAALSTVISIIISEWLGVYLEKDCWYIGKIQLKSFFPFIRIWRICYARINKTDN